MLPVRLRNKLDMLGNVTAILETQNLEEAESNLNREITKLKLANETMMSQRENQPHFLSNDDFERYYNRDADGNAYLRLPNDPRFANQYNENTRLQTSEILSVNNISDRRPYKDTALSISSDLVMALNPKGITSPTSRNLEKDILQKNPSTQDKLDQHTINSINQFTITNNSKKMQKVSEKLYEEYKHPETIEEEDKRHDLSDLIERSVEIPNRIYHESSEDEEEKHQAFTLRQNALIVKDPQRPKKGDPVENISKVGLRKSLHSSNKQSLRY